MCHYYHILAPVLLFSTLSILPTVFCSVGQVLNTTNVDSKMVRGVFPENLSRAATVDISSAVPDVNDDVVKSSENSQILLPNNLLDEGEIKKNENVFGAISRPESRPSFPSKPPNRIAKIPSPISLPSAGNANHQDKKYNYDIWNSNPLIHTEQLAQLTKANPMRSQPPQATYNNQAAWNGQIQNLGKSNNSKDAMELQDQCSIVLYGLPEINAPTKEARREADTRMATHLLIYGLGISPQMMLDCFRVGKFQNGQGPPRPRLLKVVFPAEELKLEALTQWRNNWNRIRQEWPGLNIQASRSRAQRQQQQQWKGQSLPPMPPK